MRIDRVGHVAEMTPFLAEFRRLVRRLQEIAILPLDVIDDAPPIEAAVQADGDKSRLGRHEAGPLMHHRQGLRLLARLGLNDRDLRDGLISGLNLRHGAPRRWPGRPPKYGPLIMSELLAEPRVP